MLFGSAVAQAILHQDHRSGQPERFKVNGKAAAIVGRSPIISVLNWSGVAPLPRSYCLRHAQIARASDPKRHSRSRAYSDPFSVTLCNPPFPQALTGTPGAAMEWTRRHRVRIISVRRARTRHAVAIVLTRLGIATQSKSGNASFAHCLAPILCAAWCSARHVGHCLQMYGGQF